MGTFVEFLALKYWVLLLLVAGCSGGQDYKFTPCKLPKNEAAHLNIHAQKTENTFKLILKKKGIIETLFFQEKGDTLLMSGQHCQDFTPIAYFNSTGGFETVENNCGTHFLFHQYLSYGRKKVVTLKDKNYVFYTLDCWMWDRKDLSHSDITEDKDMLVTWLQGFGLVRVVSKYDRSCYHLDAPTAPLLQAAIKTMETDPYFLMGIPPAPPVPPPSDSIK